MARLLGRSTWVELDSGGRAQLSALEIAGRNNAINFSGMTPAQKIRDVLNGVRSPFLVKPDSSRIGVFIDGTSNFLESQTNVAHFYNVYGGSKFYYGGVGNPVEYSGITKTAGGAGGYMWNAILDRAVADIKKYGQGRNVDIIGFSRGAAMANDLA